jgi:hypothetical protein
MALLTYLFAFAHFSSEILIFRTAKISIPVLTPVIVASAYHLFVRILRDLMTVLSHDPFRCSYLTCMDDLAIRLLRKSMTPIRLRSL